MYLFFLSNLSDWRVCLKYNISVPETTYNVGGGEIFSDQSCSKNGWGWPKFLPHSRRSKWLPNGSLLKIVVDVELLCEEFKSKNDKILTLQPTDFQIEEAENSLDELM